MSGDWRCLFSEHTTWEELQPIIDTLTNEYLHTFLQTLLDDGDLTDCDRGRGWVVAAPVIRKQTRAVLEQAWRDLQLSALDPSTPVQ